MNKPNDMAKLLLWRRGMPSPLGFLTTVQEAEQALSRFHREDMEYLEFKSFLDGSGKQSTTTFRICELDGVTIELDALSFATTGAMNG